MSITRRDFLGVAAGAVVGAPALAGHATQTKNCVFLVLTGGPSQLDTWDPKPAAPDDVRSPFGGIPTRVPGVRFTELFPKMAANAHRFQVVRSVHHTAAPIHETGLQLLQTGRLSGPDQSVPHLLAGGRLLPGPIGFTGVNLDRGQRGLTSVLRSLRERTDLAPTGGGHPGPEADPLSERAEYTGPPPGLFAPKIVDVARDRSRETFGRSPFGDDCLRACRLIEDGARGVVVNMFTDVYDAVSWDCHAAGGSLPSTLDDYRAIGPMFDTAYVALLTELEDRGLLRDTLVVAAGEFGRTPKRNLRGGRDHWAGAWSVLLAGAGVPGGTVIGATDARGAEPTAEPVALEELHARIAAIIGTPV